ncbi:MAG TPA: metal ABC transporter substrate-binding protein, partial [Bacteroidota bacterium]|nr:metal ABC transporter substrate-binding protein [Bacteroidota bacterium]
MTSKFVKFLYCLLVMVAPLRSAAAGDKLIVVSSIPTLKSIVELVGRDKVESFAIATGYQNPHFVDPKPSFIMKLSKADGFVTSGLDLEIGWASSLIQSSRNAKIQPGGDGYVDASRGVPLLQVPSSIDRAQGDIHIYGNPHYWLDPLRGKQIAQNIFETLAKLSPENRDYFAANLAAFDKEIDTRTAAWEKALEPLKGQPVIAYHNEWPYLEERFKFVVVDFLEPKPGIPPTPSQLVKVISEVKSKNIQIIISSPYFTTEAAELVSRQTGARLVVLASSVEAFDGVNTYY